MGSALLRPPRWRRSARWLGLVLLPGLFAGQGCGSAPASEAAADTDAAVVAIETAPVVRQPVSRVLQVTGSLTADEDADVAAETSGRVVATPVERGARVAEGAPLVRLAAAEAEAAVREAEANVAQIEVRLNLTADHPFDVDAVPEVLNARAAMLLAADEFARIRTLYDERVVSGSEFDQRRTQMEVTKRQHDTARNNARQMEQQLEAARARLALARKALADTVVRAPFAGFVVERKVGVGDYVTRGTRVAGVVRINPLRLELTVPEQHLAALRPGLPLELRVDAYPDRSFPGEVRYVSPSLRAEQRALVVEALVPNPDGVLRPGLFAVAVIKEAGEGTGLFVPSAAIRLLEGSARLYVLAGAVVEERLVSLGQVVGDATEILNGVSEGEQVATSDVRRLTDGTRVRVSASAGRRPAAGPPGR